MDNVEILCHQLFVALTMDTITQYAFGESKNYHAEPDLKLKWKDRVVWGWLC